VVGLCDIETSEHRGTPGVNTPILRRLRDWLTVSEAATELSKALGEPVTDAAVLRLGIDGHLALSLYLPGEVKARCYQINDEELDPSEMGRSIQGLCDIQMQGRAKLEIEHKCQWLLGTYVPRHGLVGVWVEHDGFLCKLPPDSGQTGMVTRAESEFPQASVLCVRRDALDTFLEQHGQKSEPSGLERPMGLRERTSLVLRRHVRQRRAERPLLLASPSAARSLSAPRSSGSNGSAWAP
jgi:hypothetical protein